MNLQMLSFWSEMHQKFGHLWLQKFAVTPFITHLLWKNVLTETPCSKWLPLKINFLLQPKSLYLMFFVLYVQANPEHAHEFSQFLNNNLAESVAKHPTRFVGLGTIPLQSPTLAIEEMKRCRYELGKYFIHLPFISDYFKHLHYQQILSSKLNRVKFIFIYLASNYINYIYMQYTSKVWKLNFKR